jgi:hypothetical protein
MSQHGALRQHSCKTTCSVRSDLITAEVEVSQRSTLHQHSCKTLYSVIIYTIQTEVQMSQRGALHQDARKPPVSTEDRPVTKNQMWAGLCNLMNPPPFVFSWLTVRQLQCGNAAPGGHRSKLCKN